MATRKQIVVNASKAIMSLVDPKDFDCSTILLTEHEFESNLAAAWRKKEDKKQHITKWQEQLIKANQEQQQTIKKLYNTIGRFNNHSMELEAEVKCLGQRHYQKGIHWSFDETLRQRDLKYRRDIKAVTRVSEMKDKMARSLDRDKALLNTTVGVPKAEPTIQ